jgi:beta-lactamase class C
MKAGKAGKAGIASILVLGICAAFGSILIQGHSHGTRRIEAHPLAAVTDTSAAEPSPITRTIREFDKFLRNCLDSMGTVGAAATVCHDREIAYTLTYGVRWAGTMDSVNRHTVFRLASVSKGFTGVLACQLDKQGRMSLDDRVIDYLPGFRLKDSVNTQDMEIRHLLSHTSGLVPHAYDNLAEDGRKIAEILPRLAEVDIAAPPGRLYGYQNVLFSLFDTLALLETGEHYPELISENIFRPLDMEDASTGYRALIWNPDVAFPHMRRNREFYPLPLHTGLYNLLPAAGLNASIDDMGKWLKALLGNSPGTIPPEVLQEISTPEVKTPLKKAYTRQWNPIEGRYYSFGWRVFDYKGHRIMYHGGYVRGYRAEIAFCPELGTGVAFLENSPDRVASLFVPTFFNLLIHEIQVSAADAQLQASP